MISVGRILEGAFGVFREHFTAVTIWGGIYLAGNLALLLVMQPIMQGALAPGAQADPAQMMSAMGPVWLLGFLMGIVGVVLYTASMRSVLRPDAGGIAFLRLGLDELRMLGLLMLFIIGGSVLFGLASTVMALFIGGIAASIESAMFTGIMSVLVVLAVFVIVLFFVVRFSLAFPLTLHRGAFAVGEAWRLSRGHFWKLFAAALVVAVIGFVASIAINMISAGSHFAEVLAAVSDPSDDGTRVRILEQRAATLGSFNMMMILQSIGGSAVAAIWIALSGGSAATAARLLVADEFNDAEEVFG